MLFSRLVDLTSFAFYSLLIGRTKTFPLLRAYFRFGSVLKTASKHIITRDDVEVFAAKLRRLSTQSPADSTQLRADIIIPVCNNYMGMKDLLSDVNATQWADNGHIIIVDDNSDDERCRELAKTFVKEKPNRSYHFRKQRGGFAATVNAGIKLTSQDVIVLNTDIRFERTALHRMLTTLNSDNLVVSTVPMTNYGFLASMPDRLKGAFGLFSGSWRAIDKTANKLFPSLSENLSIPTAFCIAIKRQYLNENGGFPEDTIGYGEDTKFGIEAQLKGKFHKLCLDTFVAHEGGASYGEGRAQLIRKGSLRILKEYPRLADAIETELQTSSASIAQLALMLATDTFKCVIEKNKGYDLVSFVDNDVPVEGNFRICPEALEAVREIIRKEQAKK